MSVPSGFHLGYRDGHGASFYIQICPLSSNKLLGELESTPSSVISLQQNFTTMAFITGQNGSDGEFFLDSFLGKKEKKRKERTCTPSLLIILTSFLFLQHTRVFPAPGPLLTLFPLPATLPPQQFGGFMLILETLVQGSPPLVYLLA